MDTEEQLWNVQSISSGVFPAAKQNTAYCHITQKNETAKNFYSSVGFKEFNRIYFEEDDELSAVLKL